MRRIFLIIVFLIWGVPEVGGHPVGSDNGDLPPLPEGILGLSTGFDLTDPDSRSPYETLGHLSVFVMGVTWDGKGTSHYANVSRDMATLEAYILENSYGRAWLDVTIVPGVQVLTQSACTGTLEAWQYARDHLGIEPLDFDHRILVVPSGCPYAGSGGGGECILSGGTAFSLLMHEFSHSMGLPHNGFYRCRDDASGVLVPFNPEGCDWREGGDQVSPNSRFHRSSLNKIYCGWLDPLDVRVSYTYRLFPYELGGPGIRALRVRGTYDRGNGPEEYFYVLTYRQRLGFDANLDEENGVIFHLGCWYYSTNTQRHCWSSTLLDMPGDGHYGLQAGRSWTDPGDLGIRFEVLPGNVTGRDGYVDVRVTFPASGDPPDPAASTVPPVLLAPGGALTYAVTVRSAAGIPLAGQEVQLEFSEYADARVCWCPGQAHPLVSAVTDIGGVALFNIAAGKCVPGTVVQVIASGVPLRTVAAVSPDWRLLDGGNGSDCEVGLPDVVAFTGPFGKGDYEECADLDGDGEVSLPDLVIATPPIQAGARCTP